MESLSPINQLINQYQKSIEESSNDPEKLTELFKEIVSRDDERLVPLELSLLQQFSRPYEFSNQQLNDIIFLANKIIPGIKEEDFKTSYRSFLGQRMLALLRGTGADASFAIGSDAVFITMDNPLINLRELSDHITTISKIFPEAKFVIDCGESCPVTSEFIKTHGKFFRSLNLEEKNLYDIHELLQDVTRCCPELSWLSLSSLTVKNLEGLENLDKLNFLKLNSYKLNEISKFPPNLKSFEMFMFYDPVVIPQLPESLEKFSLSGCNNLKLPALPEGLKILELSSCDKLEELPSMPNNLEKLTVVDCHNIRQIPKLPPGLKNLRIEHCPALTDEEKLAALDSFMNVNPDSGLKNAFKFGISDTMKVFKFFVERWNKEPLPENENPREAFVNKLSEMAGSPVYIIRLANFVYDNQEILLLDEDHPFMQEGIVGKAINDVINYAGAQFERSDDVSSIKINPATNFEYLSPAINEILKQFSGYRFDIKCEFFDPISDEELVRVSQFIKEQGDKFTSVSMSNQTNNALIQEFIKSCPYINEIILSKCDQLTSEDLKDLSNLTHLTRLTILDCNSLKELHTLPQGLTFLNIHSCNDLEALAFPKNLINLGLRSCPKLELREIPETVEQVMLANFNKLPASLPANLTHLDISGYTGSLLPPLPSNLIDFTFENLSLSFLSTVLQYDLEEGLDFLAASANVEITFTSENDEIEIEIFSPTISLEELSKHIVIISQMFPEKQIKINCTGSRFLTREFLEDHGNLFSKISLSETALIQDIIKYCPNLECISFESDSIDNLEFLDQFKNVTDIIITHCTNLKDIPKLPLSMKKLYIGDCPNLETIPPLHEGLTTLMLNNCNLKEIPTLPKSLEVLELINCENITKIPELPPGLQSIYFSECTALTDDEKLEALASFLKVNLGSGLENLFDFDISDTMKVLKALAEHLTGNPLQETQDPKEALINALEVRLNDHATDPSLLLNLAHFVCNYPEILLLNEEHPLMQHAIEILAFKQIQDERNPFQLYLKLKELAEEPSNFQPKAIEIEGIPVAINMKLLHSMSQGSKVSRKDLPTNVDRKAYDKLRYDLRDKVAADQEGANKALEELGTDWTTIETPILRDATDYLAYLLDLKGADATPVEAKWYAVLSNILDKSPAPRPQWLTEQEETFVLTLMGIQNCQGGKSIGISLSYDQLAPKYRYKSKLSKPTSIDELQQQSKIATALDFVRPFKEKTVEELVNYVNADLRARSQKIFSLIEDSQFWTEDYELNKAGAKELLDSVIRADLRAWAADTIKRLINAQFSGTDALMQKLTGVDDVEQGAHQGIYLGNLIGHLVGKSSEVEFDRNTSQLYDELLEKSRDEVLEIFFDFVTPETFVNEVLRVVNEQGEAKANLQFLLDREEYWDKEKLTRLGASALLQQLGVLS